jgi:hypothetical protein
VIGVFENGSRKNFSALCKTFLFCEKKNLEFTFQIIFLKQQNPLKVFFV